MASIREILQKERPENTIIHLYKEGVFLKGYEQSAFLFLNHIKQEYQVKTKYIKVVHQWICSIGFPESVLNALVNDLKVVPTGQGADILLDKAIDKQSYEQWKDECIRIQKEPQTPVSVSAPADSTSLVVSNDVYKQLLSFDLANKTPMQCLLFLSELQRQLLSGKIQC
jgi:hypothetical protein